jgi:hypothetical protein
MGEDQDEADGDEYSERGSTLRHEACGRHTPCQSSLIDNGKSRMVLYLRDSRDLREKLTGRILQLLESRLSRTRLLVSLILHGGLCHGYDGTCGADRDSDLDRT